MMQPEINSADLYLAALEFARSNLAYDEANTSDIAMHAMSTQDRIEHLPVPKQITSSKTGFETAVLRLRL
jgi:hypothetical protein